MKRILGTTAILLSLSGAAFAESHTSAGFGTTTAEQSDFFASDLIGMRIYNSETEVDGNAKIADGAEAEWDDIGEINDILLDENGDVKAVILGVGGFLGMGERDVTVSMDAIKVVMEEGDSNDRFLVVTTSKEELEQAPEFDRAMDDDVAAAAEEVDQATDKAAREVDQAADEAAKEVDEAADKTEAAAENAEAEVENADADQERAMLARPTAEYEGYADANMEEMQGLTAEELEGTYVYGTNDETVGEVGALVLDDAGKVTAVVINVGGFLGLGEKPVAVTWDELQVLKEADGDDFRIYIDSNKEALEALPEYQD